MLIADGNNCVELRRLEVVSAPSPAAGDVRLHVRVAAHGFGGARAGVWVEVETYQSFLEQLRDLGARREGDAEVEAITADEFWLRLRSVGGDGRLAVEGRLAQPVVGSDARRPLVQAVEFGFEFDAASLPRVVADFESLFRP